jgi:hypothetical protein
MRMWMWMSWVLVFAVSLGCEEGALISDVPVSVGLSGKADSAGQASEDMDWALSVERCAPAALDAPVLYSSDFKWGYSPEEMAARFVELYASEKRLAERAWFDPARGSFVIPNMPSWGGDVMLSNRLIENVRRHIEKALALDYAEFIFFPDMGHSHLFIPEEHWEAYYAGTPVAELSAMYSALFADPELKVLYHTAEQLQVLDANDELLDNRHLRWRFFTRNPVGDNAYLSRLDLLHDPTHKANTSRNMEGHHYQGAGFNISANENGCFPFVQDGVTMWFDVSLSDPGPDPSAGNAYY